MMDERDILITKRLVLRPMRLEDAPAIQKHFPHWDIVKYLKNRVPWPYPADGAEQFLKNVALPGMQKGSSWSWAITLKGEDELKGAVTLRRGEKENRGFWLARELHGQGLMTEAVMAVNDFSFGKAGFNRLVISNAKVNTASRRVKQKTGMRLIGEKTDDYGIGRLPAEIWELTKEDWLAWKQKN